MFKKEKQKSETKQNVISSVISLGHTIGETGKAIGAVCWNIARSENTLAILKVAAVSAALVQAIDELKKANRRIGFYK